MTPHRRVLVLGSIVVASAAAVTIGVVGARPGTADSSGAQRPTPIAAVQRLPGRTAVGDEAGNFVGYVDDSLIHPTDPAAIAQKVTPEALIPVTDSTGRQVGYVAFDYGFVSGAEAGAPGFDIVKARIARNGGCMDAIGFTKPSDYGVPTCPAVGGVDSP